MNKQTQEGGEELERMCLRVRLKGDTEQGNEEVIMFPLSWNTNWQWEIELT